MTARRGTTKEWNQNLTSCQSKFILILFFVKNWIALLLIHSPFLRLKKKCFFLNRYLKGCPSCRQQWLPSRPTYEVVTSFLLSLVPSAEPRYAMLGPGMEQLDVSIVKRLMHAPDVLPVSGTPHRQINGEMMDSFIRSLLVPL